MVFIVTCAVGSIIQFEDFGSYNYIIDAVKETHKVPGVSPEYQYHITNVYFGDLEDKEFIRVVKMLSDIKSQFHPFNVSINGISYFEAGEDGYPIILKVNSPEVHLIRNKILYCLDLLNIKYDTKYPTYQPHITLSYNDSPFSKGIKGFNLPINSISFQHKDLHFNMKF